VSTNTDPLDDNDVESATNVILNTPVSKLTEELVAETIDLCAQMRLNSVLGCLLYETIRLDRPDMREWIEGRLRHLGHTDVLGSRDAFQASQPDSTLTVVLESFDGELLDPEAIKQALSETAKLRGWKPGDHLVARVAVHHMLDHAKRAARIIGIDPDADAVAKEATE